MNPLDSNVEPIGAVSESAMGPGVLSSHREASDHFLTWLSLETIAITAEHFGSECSLPITRATQFRSLPRTA